MRRRREALTVRQNLDSRLAIRSAIGLRINASLSAVQTLSPRHARAHVSHKVVTVFSDINQSVSELLIERGETVSVAESSAGGLIAANLLSIAGASHYFKGGSVVYTRESRHAFLDLDVAKLRSLKPLTEPMVAEFALAARLKLKTTWGIAELGAAGPSGTPYGHGPGTCVIGISGPVNRSLTVETQSDDREQNMATFAEAALSLFQEALSANG